VFAPEAPTQAHQKNGHASPTLIAEGERLYAHFGPYGTASLKLSGETVWKNNDFKYPPIHGNGGSPALCGDLLVFSCDGASNPFVVALRKNDGSLAWKVPRQTEAQKTFSFCTPLIIDVNGKKEIISPGSNAVIAYDPKDGAEIWRARYNGYSVVPRPVFANGLLFIGTGFDHPTVMAIRPDGAGDVTTNNVVWTVSKAAPNTPSLLVVGEELYMVSDGGMASCLNSRTGEIYWQERLSEDSGNYSASPLHADGKIYFQSEEGNGTVIRASKQFEKLAKNSVGERTLASYAVAGSTFVIRGEKHLFRVGEKR
jgi:outer membrane protein assembly factor BamB